MHQNYKSSTHESSVCNRLLKNTTVNFINAFSVLIFGRKNVIRIPMPLMYILYLDYTYHVDPQLGFQEFLRTIQELTGVVKYTPSGVQNRFWWNPVISSWLNIAIWKFWSLKVVLNLTKLSLYLKFMKFFQNFILLFLLDVLPFQNRIIP